MIDPSTVRVTMQDARIYQNGCVAGWQAFVETHGYSFKDVVKHGLTAQQLIDTDDVMAIELAYAVIQREEEKLAESAQISGDSNV